MAESMIAGLLKHGLIDPNRIVASHPRTDRQERLRAQFGVEAVEGNRAAALDYTLAQSIIWLARPKLNFMLEATWTRAQEVVGPGDTQAATEFLVSPGVRGAIDLPSGLQIVPGLAFPIGVGPSRGERSVFLYLSLEHAFARQGP